jgi:CBS domain-containing protein
MVRLAFQCTLQIKTDPTVTRPLRILRDLGREHLLTQIVFQAQNDGVLRRCFMADSALPTFRFPVGTVIAQAHPPQQVAVTLESSGTDVMTDLTQVRAATVPPGISLAQAEISMIHQGVRLLFVVSHMPGVDGIVTAADLQGERPMQLVSRRHVKFEDLTVADVMTPLPDIDVIDFAFLRRANVRQVIAALVKTGHAHMLVIEHASRTTPERIRGVISKTQIERQVGTQLPESGMATSFAEMTAALP